MCGILAVLHAHAEDTDVAAELHEALYLLQHRGQDACGIAVCGSRGRIHQCKGNGLAAKVFRDGSRVPDLPGYMGIGHLRYPTAGTSANAEAQPFFVNSPYGISFAHNGNLINAVELRNYLDREAHRHINTESDSEIMLNIFASELNLTGKARVNCEDILTALGRMYDRLQGGWACTVMLAGFGIIGFRDPYGIRPLILGERESRAGEGRDYVMASESVVLQQLGYNKLPMKDIKPGEAVIIQKGREPRIEVVRPKKGYCPDIFEYLYFARPDTVIDGINVHESRENMGYKLADQIRQQLTESQFDEIDAVMAIPETSNTAAPCVAARLGKPYRQGFCKSRYVHRTFILPSQAARQQGVRRKLSTIPKLFAGKNVLLVDDSIVRGTTSREIVLMAKEAGAKKVYLASAAPRITHPHIYGIDLASPSELIAHRRSVEEIAAHVGAAKVIFQSLEDLVDACREAASPGTTSSESQEFEVGVFNGQYVTPVPEGYFTHLERVRGESKKMKVIASARQAVADGMADDQEMLIALNGAEITSDGAIVPSSPAATPDSPRLTNGNQSLLRAQKRRRTMDEETQPERRQDISIENQDDYGLEY